MIFLFYFACQFNSTPVSPRQSIGEVLQIWEQVSNDPISNFAKCDTILHQEHKNTCYLLALEKMKYKHRTEAENICAKMQEKGECFFQLGEVYDSIDYCMQAQPFHRDCQFHLLSRRLFKEQIQDYATAVKICQHYSIDIHSIEGETIVYRHLISQQQPLSTSLCTTLPNPPACYKAAHSIYLDRLRYHHNITHHFQCNQPLITELTIDEFSPLQQTLRDFVKEVCP